MHGTFQDANAIAAWRCRNLSGLCEDFWAHRITRS